MISDARDVVVDLDAADRGGEDERHAAGPRLLVPGERVEDPRRLQVRHRRPGPDVVHRRGDGVVAGLRQQVPAPRDEGRPDEAPADRLAVGEAAVAGHRLEGVADRVAEVEDAPQAALALVPLHDLGLDATGGGDRALHRDPVPAAEAGRGLAQGGEEGAVAEDRALQDLVGARRGARARAAWRGTRGRPRPRAAGGTPRSGSWPSRG